MTEEERKTKKRAWKVTSSHIRSGVRVYQVYRMCDIQNVDRSSNREVVFSTTDEQEAEYYAQRLNKLPENY